MDSRLKRREMSRNIKNQNSQLASLQKASMTEPPGLRKSVLRTDMTLPLPASDRPDNGKRLLARHNILV
jgi:hypothetical protein